MMHDFTELFMLKFFYFDTVACHDFSMESSEQLISKIPKAPIDLKYKLCSERMDTQKNSSLREVFEQLQEMYRKQSSTFSLCKLGQAVIFSCTLRQDLTY